MQSRFRCQSELVRITAPPKTAKWRAMKVNLWRHPHIFVLFPFEALFVGYIVVYLTEILNTIIEPEKGELAELTHIRLHDLPASAYIHRCLGFPQVWRAQEGQE